MSEFESDRYFSNCHVVIALEGRDRATVLYVNGHSTKRPCNVVNLRSLQPHGSAAFGCSMLAMHQGA